MDKFLWGIVVGAWASFLITHTITNTVWENEVIDHGYATKVTGKFVYMDDLAKLQEQIAEELK